MQLNVVKNRVEETELLPQSEIKFVDCMDMLASHGLTYSETGHYLEVGNNTFAQGWILHISAIRVQLTSLLNTILPILKEAQVPFKIPRTKQLAKEMLDGSLGPEQIGKIISVYPRTEDEAVALAKILVSETFQFRGPAISGERLLGGTVYTKYMNLDSVSSKYENWPFEQLVPALLPVTKPLLNYRYRPLAIIKPDLKGRVIQGNYFKGPFHIKLCVIKEGVKNMWADEFGRDIIDRLKWQYDLYKDLSGHVPSPEIFDYFEEQGNTYLAMEFIKGDSLSDKVSSIYQGDSWFQLSITQKTQLIDYFLKVLSTIEKLHEKGYVHRDITPANFIINKKDEVFLIDLELAYSITHRKPDPAFKLGTPGYMSPEQFQREIPTIKEDIYALGCLMIFVFTGLSPLKIGTLDEATISTNLSFFSENFNILVNTIQQCISRDPFTRPSLSDIKAHVETYLKNIQSSSIPIRTTSHPIAPGSEQLKTLINEAIIGMNSNQVISQESIWTSIRQQNDLSGIQPTGRVPLKGFQTGLAGILYLLARANQLGYNIDSCRKGLTASWQFIQDSHLAKDSPIELGLFNGTSGLALALQEAMNANILDINTHKIQLESYFSPIYSQLNIAEGVAGQILSLIRCRRYLHEKPYTQIIQTCVDTLLKHQQKDGSWHNLREKKNDNLIGFAYGTAGILCSLLSYTRYHKDDLITASIQKGLHWLYKQMKRTNGQFYWTTSSKSKSIDKWSCDMGIPGVALTFIQAYELFGEAFYKNIAEYALQPLAKQPISVDYTQGSGLSGLGEVYLEACRVLGREKWQERIDWIANEFVHTILHDKDQLAYWSVDIFPDHKVDLMTGTSGILHFLMRYQNEGQLGHIILDK